MIVNLYWSVRISWCSPNVTIRYPSRLFGSNCIYFGCMYRYRFTLHTYVLLSRNFRGLSWHYLIFATLYILSNISVYCYIIFCTLYVTSLPHRSVIERWPSTLDVDTLESVQIKPYFIIVSKPTWVFRSTVFFEKTHI